MDKYIGRLLDNRYEILEVIGTGGMAVVYKARCHRLNRLVAIKILKDDYLEDEDFRARFHAESQAVAMLSHPNIVAVYDVSTSIMADYIVMELIDGITLKQYMEKKGVLNWKETLHFAIQIAKALEHAHSRGIVHRDIKPHNVMVLKNGSVKVADFGIARMMSEGNTLTKEALGSVHYISPEQARGGRVDNRSDIYSLGVVMYEMMAGRPPYDGDSPVSVAIAHINGGAPLPSTYNPNIPGGMEQIIMKAMAHDLSDRYPTATRMLADMDEFRKDPTILFDYNLPPLDAVTHMPRPVLELQPQTTAQRVARRENGGSAGTPVRKQPEKNPVQEARRRERREQREQEEQRKNRVATAVIATCSLVAVIAVIVFLIALFNGGAFKTNDKLVTVPPLVNQVFSQLPDYPELEIIKELAHDELIPEGLIISQNPVAGKKVVRGSRVVVTVSMGPPPRIVTMQDLVDMTLDQATGILQGYEMNLVIVNREEFSDTIAPKNITRTEPGANVQLKPGQEIVLWVSKGKEIRTGEMPDLVNQPKDVATRILLNRELDLRISYDEVYDSKVPAGQVLRTEPEKGTELKTGQAVKLYISKGPEKAKIPYVVGIDIEKAVNILISAGFGTPSIEPVESDEEKDVVVYQSVEPNTFVDVTTEIVLKISAGKKEEPTTEPTEEPTEPTANPSPIVQDVTLTIAPDGLKKESLVTVFREGREVYRKKLKAGTKILTLRNQKGLGPVKYEIVIDGGKPKIEWVPFGDHGD